MGGTPKKTAHIGPPRSLKKTISRNLEIFSRCFHKTEIASGPPQSCHAACLYPRECGGMSCATSRPLSGPGRVGFRLATVVFPLHPWLIMGQAKLPPRDHSADSLEGEHVSTMVCRTYGWDPQNCSYRASTEPEKNDISRLGNLFQVFS